ncbi:MAG: hypothetical protein CMJ62_11150 [Planctomycetaceae bacterium]|nr:hypothetical protein [Planctomycetaceae bacterium]
MNLHHDVPFSDHNLQDKPRIIALPVSHGKVPAACLDHPSSHRFNSGSLLIQLHKNTSEILPLKVPVLLSGPTKVDSLRPSDSTSDYLHWARSIKLV